MINYGNIMSIREDDGNYKLKMMKYDRYMYLPGNGNIMVII